MNDQARQESLTLKRAPLTFAAAWAVVFKREVGELLRSPQVFLLIAAFAGGAAALTFFVGDFFGRNEADLRPFFITHPYLFWLLLPALTSARAGNEGDGVTAALPLSAAAVVTGRAAALWTAAGLALVGTFPMWLTVSLLGHPDQGAIIAGYAGSWLIAALFIAVGVCVAGASRRPASAYVVTAALCGALLFLGLPAGAAAGVLPPRMIEVIGRLSALNFFDRFIQGRLSLDVIFYFIITVGVWLRAAVWGLEDRRRCRVTPARRLTYILTAVAWVGALIASSVIFSRFRFDATSDGRHTPAPAAVRLLTGIEDPVTVTLYVSRQARDTLPGVRAYAERAAELLRNFADVSQGRLRAAVVSAEPFSEQEDAAAAAGLLPLNLPNGAVGYFGVTASNKTDGHAVLPLLAAERETFLEYDLIRMIDGLEHAERPRVGLLTSLPLAIGPGGVSAALQGKIKPYALYRELAARVELVPLTDDAATLDLSNLQAVIVLHPQPLSPGMRFLLEQYALRGGRLLLFADPLLEWVITPDPYSAPPPASSDLNGLLGLCGVRMRPDAMVLDPERARFVNVEGQQSSVPYAAWPALAGADFNRHDPVSASPRSLGLGSAGFFEAVPGQKPTCTMTPLVSTSASAGVIGVQKLQEASAARLPQVPATGKMPVAVRLHGPCAALTQPVAGVKQTQPLVSKGECRMMAVADADLWDDRFWLAEREEAGRKVGVPFAGNADFVLNAVDSLLGTDDLLTLRGGGSAARPLAVLDAVRTRSENELLPRLKAAEAAVKAASAKVQTGRGEAADYAVIADGRRVLRELQRTAAAELETVRLRIMLLNLAAVPLAAVAGVLAAAARRRAGGRL